MKRLERVLQILILAELILIVLGAVVEFAHEPALLAELRAHVSSRAAAPHVGGTLLTVLWAVVALGTLLGWTGLLCLVREARGLYLGSWVAYLGLNLLRGPVVDTALGSVVQTLVALVGGGIVSMIYLSGLRSRFRSLAQVARGTMETP